MLQEKKYSAVLYHIIICLFGFVMVYPLAWMIMSSFKESNTIFWSWQFFKCR